MVTVGSDGERAEFRGFQEGMKAAFFAMAAGPESGDRAWRDEQIDVLCETVHLPLTPLAPAWDAIDDVVTGRRGARMLYFDDIRPGGAMRSPTYSIDEDEMIEFARRWDPVPIHVDPESAGGVTASGTYVLAVKARLLHELPESCAIIGSAGYDELRFHEPVRSGDIVHVVMEWLEARASRSKPDRGVVKLRISLVNQDGVTAMSHLDTLIVQRRS